ncbi:MAG: hypothetical protein H7A40_05175 [Chlamydiales bacterium]|nr:hypothetical protein [Chlamydiales bacterium]
MTLYVLPRQDRKPLQVTDNLVFDHPDTIVVLVSNLESTADISVRAKNVITIGNFSARSIDIQTEGDVFILSHCTGQLDVRIISKKSAYIGYDAKVLEKIQKLGIDILELESGQLAIRFLSPAPSTILYHVENSSSMNQIESE